MSIADFLLILIIPTLACVFSLGEENLQKNILFWLFLAAITVFLVASHGGYRRAALLDVGNSNALSIRYYWATCLSMLSAAWLTGHQHAVTLYWTSAELGLTPVMLALARNFSLPQINQAAAQAEGVGPILVCFDRAPLDLTKALAEHRINGTISGVLYLAAPVAGSVSPWPVIANIQSLIEIVRVQKIQNIIFMYQPELEQMSAAARQALLSELLGYPARVWMAFDLQPQLPNMLANRSGRYRMVPLVTDHLINSLNMTKRLFDLAAGMMLLTVTAPVMAGIALAVRLSSRGPVVFRQIRTGAHGRRFTVLKFRTMGHATNANFAQARRNDPRVTRVGRFLRRYSLDELLQLFNVVAGDMSMVGPRPHAPETQVQGIGFEDAVKLYRLRQRVKPGITGLAQIRGQRGETRQLKCLEQRIQSDLEYIETWSLGLDVMILWRTLPALFAPKNAH